MKHRARFATCIFALPAFVLFAAVYAAYAGGDKLGPYDQIATVPVPSGLAGGFDISWVDSTAGRYYLADRGNSTASPTVPPGVDVLDTKHPSFLYEIPLLNSKGTNGVVVIYGAGDGNTKGTLVVGGNDSNTYFVDLAHPFAVPIAVSTGGKVRADELAYDATDQII